ncbi:MAG: hypothetical protein GXZ11_01220 [Tissierellia bacterium]|nr:hypothetical protein [Tissierellia bacterium]
MKKVTIRLEENTWRDLRQHCLDNDTSMQAVFEEHAKQITGGNEMLKYEIVKNTLEIKKMEDYKEGCTYAYEGDQDPEIIKSFNSKEEALEELKKYEADIRRGSGVHVVTEYYVEENEYDEDGEIVESKGVWDFAPLGE